MLTDKVAKIQFRVNNQPDEIELVITGDQLEETMRRRMKTMMPRAQITDISEVFPDSQQIDIKQGAKKS